MNKLIAIQNYLYAQFKYDFKLTWIINGTICVVFTILGLFVPENVNFTLTPSGAIYIIVIVYGATWIRRTLSHLLRLGINRKDYSIGSFLFFIMFNIVNIMFVIAFYFLFQFLETINLTPSLFFLHPSQLFTNTPQLPAIILFDFIAFNLLSLVSILFSIAYHRLGKVGGNSIMGVLAILFIINVASNGMALLFKWLTELSVISALSLGVGFIIILFLLFVLCTRKISILKSSV